MRRMRFPELGLPGGIECVIADEETGEPLDRYDITGRGTVDIPDNALLIFTADRCRPTDLARVSRDAFATMLLTGVDDELLGVVATMTDIYHLSLCGEFTDAGMRALDWTTDMFALELDSPHIGPDLRLPGASISVIEIRGDRVDDGVFDAVAAKNPYTVDIAGPALTGARLAALAAAPELEEIRITGRALRAEHLDGLAETGVTALYVKPERIDADWIDALLGVPQLRSIELEQFDPAPLSPRDLGRLLAAGRQVNGIRAGAAELAATAAELAVAEDVGGAEAPELSGLPGLRSITDAAEFDAVLAEGVPVLVQLTATWCGPCRHLRPILERVVAGFSGRITGVVVDIDRSPWAERFDARSVPTVIAFAGGREVLRFVGVRSERDITALLGAAVELDGS